MALVAANRPVAVTLTISDRDNNKRTTSVIFPGTVTVADILANLDATRRWVLEQNEENLAAGRAYLEGRGPFPQRAALNQLGGRFLTDFYVTVARWVRWAENQVSDWPDDVLAAPYDTAEGREAVGLAESIDEILGTPLHP